MKGKGGLRRSMPIYLTLRTADAMRLQDLPGGDGARVAFLTSLGVQMVRCFGFGAWWQSLLSGRQGYTGLTLTKLSSHMAFVVLRLGQTCPSKLVSGSDRVLLCQCLEGSQKVLMQ